MPSLGRAYVEVHADTRPFGRELRADIDAYLATADKQMSAGGSKIGKTFSNSFSAETKKGFTGVAREFESGGERITRTARTTATRFRREFKKGLDASERDTRNWGSRVANYFSSMAFNAITGIQSVAGALVGPFTAAMQGAGSGGLLLLGIILLIEAALIALTPIMVGLASGVALLAGGLGAVLFAMAPLLVVFKELSPVLGDLTADTKTWNADLKKIPPSLRPLATVLRQIALSIKGLSNNGLIKALVGPLSQVNKFINSKEFQKNWKTLNTISGKFLSNLLRAFQTPTWASAFNKFIGTIGTIFEDDINPFVSDFVGMLGDLFNDPAFQSAISNILGLVVSLADTFARWIDQAAKDGSLDTFLNNVEGIFFSLVALAQDLFGMFAQFATPEQLENTRQMLDTIDEIVRVVTGWLASKKGQQFISDMITIVGFLASTAVFTFGVFMAIDAALHDVAKAFKFAWNALRASAAESINAVIGMINKFIGVLNTLLGLLNKIFHTHWKIPPIPGVKVPGSNSRGGSDTQLIIYPPKGGSGGGGGGGRPPKALAAGGVVDRPTFSLIGEAGREVVVPLTNPARARALADQSGLTSLLGGDQVIYVMVDLDGQPFYSYVAKALTSTGAALATGVRR